MSETNNTDQKQYYVSVLSLTRIVDKIFVNFELSDSFITLAKEMKKESDIDLFVTMDFFSRLAKKSINALTAEHNKDKKTMFTIMKVDDLLKNSSNPGMFPYLSDYPLHIHITSKTPKTDYDGFNAELRDIVYNILPARIEKAIIEETNRKKIEIDSRGVTRNRREHKRRAPINPKP